MVSRRGFVVGVVGLAAGLARGEQPSTRSTSRPAIPVSGEVVSALRPFDDLMFGFMRQHDVPAASLAVGRRGKLLYARGFGFADLARTRPVGAGTPFRIASVSKPFTAVAVMQLAAAGKLKLDDPVLTWVKQPVRDKRWEAVTVRHCLQHRSGMDRDVSGDPIGMVGRIAKELGTGYPVSATDVMRWSMLRPLDHVPGERMAYSNVGYLVLGRVIEAASGKGYVAYVTDEVLKRVGTMDMAMGHALPEKRPAGEVAYVDREKGMSRCLFPPRVGQQVPTVDGGMNIEGFEAHGGWIASAADLVRFATDFDRPDGATLLPATAVEEMFARPPGETGDVWYGCGWQVHTAGPKGSGRNTWHNGLLNPGTSSLMVRRWDGLSWAVLFNTHANAKGETLAGLIDGPLHGAANAVGRWP